MRSSSRRSRVAVLAALLTGLLVALAAPSALAVGGPPTLDPVGSQTVAEGATASITVTGSDAEGDAVSFLALPGAPGFADLTDNGDDTATLTLTPGYSDAGTYSMTIVAFNGDGNDQETITITVTNTDRSPVLGAIGNQSVAEGATATVNVTASDPDGDSVSFLTLPGAPSWATLTDNGDDTATLTLTPGLDDSGSYTLTVVAFNGGGNDSETFTVTVTNTNQAPVLAPIAAQTVAEGATLDVSVSATDPDGDSLSFLPSSLPGWATFTDNGDGTGVLHLAPGYSDAGPYTIRMLVTDSFLDDSQDVTVTVTDTDRAPVLAPIGDQVVGAGSTLVVPVSATDPDGDPLLFLPGPLPSWATFVDNNDGTGTLTLSPAATDLGSVDIRMLVTDSTLDTIENFTVYVVDPDGPTVFVPGDLTVAATDANGAVVTFTATAQDLLDGDLTPTCTPPSGSTFPVGTTTVTCTVTDTDDNTGSASFTVTVTPAGTPTTTPTDTPSTPGGNPTTPEGGAGPTGSGPASLAQTGASPAGPIGLAVTLLGAGAVLVLTSRRRTRAH